MSKKKVLNRNPETSYPKNETPSKTGGPLPGPGQGSASLESRDGDPGIALLGAASTLDLLKRSIDISPDSVYWLDADGNFQYINESGCEALGYGRDELLKMHVSAVNPRATPARWAEVWQALKDRGTIKIESVHRRKDGSEFPVELIYTYIFYEGREYCNGFARDITERRQAMHELSESQALLFNSFNNSPLLMTISDLDTGKYLQVNDSFCRVSEFSRQEAVGKTSIELGWISDQSRAGMLAELTGKGKLTGLELALRSKTGRPVICRCSGEIIQTAGGRKLFITAEDITGYRQEQEALRRSEERLKAIASNTPDHILMQDRQLRYIFVVNPQLGLTEEMMLGKTDYDILSKEEADDLTSMKRKVIEAGKPVQVETSLVSRSGGREYFEGSYVPKFNSHQEVDGLIGYFRNVTQGRLAEEQLRLSEANLRQAQRVAHVGIWTWHIQSNRLEWSDEMYPIFGIQKENFSGDLAEVINRSIHPDDRTAVEASNVSVIKVGKPIPLEYRVIWPDGSIRVVWAEAGELKLDSSGKPATLTGIVQDITARKQAEQTLQETEEKYQQVFEVESDALIIMDLETGRFLEANPAASRLYGYSRKEILKLRNVDLTAQVEETRQSMAKKPVLVPLRYHRRKDGSVFPVEINPSDLTWHGRPARIAAIRDITARIQSEQKLKEYSDHLEEMVEERTRELRQAQEEIVRSEKLAVLGKLAGAMGHELRNPLGVISSAVYYLKLVQPDADEKIRQYHAVLENEVRNAEKIIADLLDFARLESVKPERTEVLGLCQRVLVHYPPPDSIDVTLKVPDDLPAVFADPRQAEQVLGNLVTNACQAMLDPKASSSTGVAEPRTGSTTEVKNQGRLTISASLKKEKSKRMVAIAVKDTGVGISPENRARLFEPLFTTRAKGIGLGLPISRKLAEANGGRIEVTSKPGQGSTFSLYLPVNS